MDNQFITSPLLVANPRSAVYVDPKEELIRGLELKNNKIKTELIKIQRIIEQKLEESADDTAPKKRQSLFQSQQNIEVLNKQLVNTYKRIKMYEYEISKLEESSKTISVAHKVNQTDVIIKEKKSMAEKLRLQFMKEKKVVEENMKKLQNGNQKQELDRHVKSLNDECKFLRQKVKQFQARQAMKAANMKKQFQFIKKLQNQILQAGVAGGELDDMKQRAIRSIDVNARRREGTLNQTRMKQSETFQEEQEIQDRTREHFNQLLGEITLLEKLLQDYDKQTALLEEEKQESMKKNLNSRNRLLECETEIEMLQKEILSMKGKVVLTNLKPLKHLRALSSQQTQVSKDKISPNKTTKPIKTLMHLLKYDEVGFASAAGQRFTDRNMLGKSSLLTKLTGMKVFIDRTHGCIAGIQWGEHVRKDKQARQKQYTQEQFSCKDKSFIKNIAGTLNEDDKLQSLSIITTDGFSHKFGNPKTNKKSFSFEIGSDEYPVCVFGSLIVIRQPGKKEYSMVQHIGFEVSGDKNGQHAHENEFNE